MEYYEDRFEFEQAQNRDYCSYYTLNIDGVDYAQGTYEDCVEERDLLIAQYGKSYGLTKSDFTIEHHSYAI